MSFFIQYKTLERLSDLLKKKQCKTERLLKKKKKSNQPTEQANERRPFLNATSHPCAHTYSTYILYTLAM